MAPNQDIHYLEVLYSEWRLTRVCRYQEFSALVSHSLSVFLALDVAAVD